MKKILSLVLSALLILSVFAGCKQKDTNGASSGVTSQDEAVSSVISSEEETSSQDNASDVTSSEENSSDKNSSVESEKPDDSTASEKPACKHTNKKAVSVNTGKNIIDASKLDVVNHKLVCADCKKELGTEKHKVKDGKCTLCNQNNLKTKTTTIVAAGPTYEGDLKVNKDGSVAFEVMLSACWHSAAKLEYAVDQWNYKIPADVMLEAIRKRFVITDAQFEKLKAQGKYKFAFDTHTFEDGYFCITDPAAGGPGEKTHEHIGYVDDKHGKFTVYIDYMDGGADVEEHKHISYYAVEYTYSGYSNLSIKAGEWYKEIVGFESVVDSLRVTSIKNVSSLPANMVKC